MSTLKESRQYDGSATGKGGTDNKGNIVVVVPENVGSGFIGPDSGGSGTPRGGKNNGDGTVTVRVEPEKPKTTKK